MLKFVENAFLSMQEKEREKKQELERAKQLNNQLKTRLKVLEEENKELREKFTKNEVDIITRKNELNNLLENLQNERRSALEQSQRLQICREQIDSINNFIGELRPVQEQLNFKENVTECLHDLLIKTKLRIAESDDLLQDLHDYLTQLEYDVEKTRNVHRQGIGHWQDEFLAARIREADVILEFDKIKREIATIKNELEEKILIADAQQTVSGSPPKSLHDVTLTPRHEAIFLEEELTMTRTLELMNEVDFLKQKLRKLEDQKKDCEAKISTNEEIKVHLSEVRKSMWLREFETKQKTEILQERYAKLAEKMSQELSKIQSSIEEKDLGIARIEEKIKELQLQNNFMEEDLKNLPADESEVELEEQRNSLEEEIAKLKKT